MGILDESAIQVVSCADFPGNNPFAVVEAWAPRTIVYNPEDKFVTLDLINETISRGYNAALYWVVPRSGDLDRFGRAASQKIETLGGKAKIAAAMFDNEKVPLDLQRTLIRVWDFLRYGRPTWWNVEPFQDQTQNDYAAMLARNVVMPGVRKVTTQTYFGGMQPQRMRDVIDYLTARGVARDDLCVCTDPEQPASYLQTVMGTGTRGGTLFEAGRIPR